VTPADVIDDVSPLSLPHTNNLKLKGKGYWQTSLQKGICRFIDIIRAILKTREPI
jgi:hypothetical protein